jgi:hypothetical protein
MTDTFTATRRSLHAVAERLLAGPEYRAVQGLALRVVPGGFATAEGPAVRVDGTDLVVDESRRVPLTGSIGEVAAAAGVDEGAPEGVYHDGSDLGDEPLSLDPAALQIIVGWYIRADAALRAFAPGKTPILWPEHFDVAVDIDDSTFGASPGDGFSPDPYAYISTPAKTDDPFWNAPFGAYVGHTDAPTIEALVRFWKHGRPADS